MLRPIAFARSRVSSPTLRRTRLFSRGETLFQVSNARCAAASARSRSARVACGSLPMTVAGRRVEHVLLAAIAALDEFAVDIQTQVFVHGDSFGLVHGCHGVGMRTLRNGKLRKVETCRAGRVAVDDCGAALRERRAEMILRLDAQQAQRCGVDAVQRDRTRGRRRERPARSRSRAASVVRRRPARRFHRNDARRRSPSDRRCGIRRRSSVPRSRAT